MTAVSAWLVNAVLERPEDANPTFLGQNGYKDTGALDPYPAEVGLPMIRVEVLAAHQH